jgi:hypothetical protein
MWEASALHQHNSIITRKISGGGTKQTRHGNSTAARLQMLWQSHAIWLCDARGGGGAGNFPAKLHHIDCLAAQHNTSTQAHLLHQVV